MRLDIRYRMAFQYSEPAREAHSEIRVRPRDLPSQRLLAHRLTCDPAARVLSFTDYWGTTVDHVGRIAGHDRFEILAESAVETRQPKPIETAPMQGLDDESFILEHLEFLAESPHVEQTPEIHAVGLKIISGSGDVVSAVQAVVDEVRNRLSYVTGSTRIGIPLGELLSGRQGVCQDFAHLTIGWLRGAAIPARYVSGYLFASDETTADSSDSTVEVQTHAWVEAAIPGKGWMPIDPTNNRPVGERHVVIGFGRDYDDVAPVRGVYVGDATPEVEAVVEMRRMEPMERSVAQPIRRRSMLQPAIPHPPDVAAAQQQQQQQ